MCARAHSPLLPHLGLEYNHGVWAACLPRFSIHRYLHLHYWKQGGERLRRSVWGSWSDGENFLCIRRKFLLALTAIFALTAWVPRQLFFLCWVLCLLLFTLHSPGQYFFLIFFLLNQRAASWCCWSHPQQKARRPAHTLHNTPSLSHSILALIKTLSF